MGDVIDLREMVPRDITLVFDDAEWQLPGDLPNDVVWDLYGLLLEVAQIPDVPASAPGAKRALAQVRQIDERIQAILLVLLKQRHPELDRLPFGSITSRVVTEEVLRRIGFLRPEDEEEPEGEDPTVEGPEKVSGSSTTGSGRSSRSSGSSRASGGSSRTKRPAPGTPSDADV